MSSTISCRAIPAQTLRLLAVALIGTLLTAGAAAAPAEDNTDAQQREQGKRTYDHFLYLRCAGDDSGNASLVLAEVTPEGFQQRDIFSQKHLYVDWEPFCVVDGRFYVRYAYMIFEIDLATCNVAVLTDTSTSYTYDSGRLYSIPRAGDSLHVFDLKTRTSHELCSLSGGAYVAISPGGKYLGGFLKQRRLTLVDLGTGETKTVGPAVRMTARATRGFQYVPGPLFTWLDEKTVLLIHEGEGGPPPVLSPAPKFLATIDIDSGRLSDLITLPTLTPVYSDEPRMLSEIYLGPLGDDLVPRILLGGLGQYRVDVEAERLVEDDTLIAPYALTRGITPVRLLCGRTELCRAGSIPDVAVSPDGRRVVWLTVPDGGEEELRYHDLDEEATRLVAKGSFATPSMAQRHPGETLLFWVAAEDLATAPPTEPPAGWEPFRTAPWPPPPGRPRPPEPEIDDFFSLAVSADKETYRQHEPARLTFTLTNKMDQQVELKRSTGSSKTFRVTRTSPLGSSIIDVVEDMLPIPPEQPGEGPPSDGAGRPGQLLKAGRLTLEPSESLRVVRLMELPDLGRNTVVARIILDVDEYPPYTRSWRGPVEAESLSLDVVPSPDNLPLLQAELERVLTLCRQEYDRNQNWGDYTRLYDLGPSAVPLIVDALEACDEVKFRRRMGKGLAAMATADALPYFERLLAGDMEDDWEMVLDGLATMIAKSRSPEEALDLLLSAMKHSDPGIRSRAADRLRAVYDPRVAAAMRDFLGEIRPLAEIAAVYLAAYERLDMADWLALAAEEPTKARFLATGPIIERFRLRWETDLPVLPRADWDQLVADADLMAEYKTVVRAWAQWARENPRTSARFFDIERRGWPEQQPATTRAAADPAD